MKYLLIINNDSDGVGQPAINLCSNLIKNSKWNLTHNKYLITLDPNLKIAPPNFKNIFQIKKIFILYKNSSIKVKKSKNSFVKVISCFDNLIAKNNEIKMIHRLLKFLKRSSGNKEMR